MSDTKNCLFCGKPIIGENDKICDECKDHVDHQYTTDLLDGNDSGCVLDEKVEPQDVESAPQRDELRSVIEGESVGKLNGKRRSKISKGAIFLIVGCVVLIVIGIVGALDIAETRNSKAVEDEYWANIVAENTPLSYSKYLIKYPEGSFALDAENRIREFRKAELRAWEELQKSTDINDFYAYLSENPETPHLGRIRMIMDSLSWITTLKDNTADAYKAYIENVNLGNLTGYYVGEAEDKYLYLSEIKVLDGGTLESLKLDLSDFFKKMSDNKPKDLLKEFSPRVNYYTSEMASTAVVSLISKKYADEKIKKITYKIKPESVFAKQDNKGLALVDLTIVKEIDYSARKKKNEVITQNLSIEMTSDKLVQSIKIRK